MKIGGILALLVLTVNALRKYQSNLHLSQGLRNWRRTKISKAVPKICDSVAQTSGRIDTYFGAQFFFWYFESRNQPRKDPLIVYINGALGASSILGLNSGMFPCHVSSSGNGTRINPNSWNNFANLLLLDPIGVGFAPKDWGEESNARLKAINVVNALRQFMRAHPTLKSTPIHLASESYGAAIVLETAKQILRTNNMNGAEVMPLKSAIVGSAMLDAYVQYSTLPFLASRFKIRLGSVNECQDAILKCRGDEEACEASVKTCISNLIQPYQAAGYNLFQLPGFVSPRSDYVDISNLNFLSETFLNLDETKRELGIPYNYTFNYLNPSIFEMAVKSIDYIKDHTVTIGELVAGNIKVLYYGGEMDYVCNPLGFISTLENPTHLLKSALNGVIGSVTYTDNLTAVKFANASHYVQIDQPQRLYEIVTRWVTELSI